jgi:YggT family protein
VLFARFIQIFCNIMIAAIVVRALLSWFTNDPRNPLVAVLDQITEPILAPIRRIMPRTGMLDFTPIVAIVILIAIQSLIVSFYQS